MYSANVEALLVRAPIMIRCTVLSGADRRVLWLAGRLRTVWRGFDGGQDARSVITDFFANVKARSKPGRASTTSSARNAP